MSAWFYGVSLLAMGLIVGMMKEDLPEWGFYSVVFLLALAAVLFSGKVKEDS